MCLRAHACAEIKNKWPHGRPLIDPAQFHGRSELFRGGSHDMVRPTPAGRLLRSEVVDRRVCVFDRLMAAKESFGTTHVSYYNDDAKRTKGMYRQRIQKAWGYTAHRGWARLLLNRARDLAIHGPAHRGANGAAMPTDEGG